MNDQTCANRSISSTSATSFLSSCALLAALSIATPAQAIDRPASIEARGEGAIFDVKGGPVAGTLRVCTKAARAGNRWRVTIAQANAAGAVSAVGNGSTAAFTGCVTRAVSPDVAYIVYVTWDRPLPGAFPAQVSVRFTGPTDANAPPVTQLNGQPLTNIVPRPIRWPEPPGSCPANGSAIGCEALVKCALDPAGDTDIFKITVPANADLSINAVGPTGTYWRLHAPDGSLVNPSGCFGVCQLALTNAGTYTIQLQNYYNYSGPYQLSMLGISTPFRCGPSALPGGSPIKGEFNAPGDTDSYQLNNVQADETYSVNLVGPTGSYWIIFDPSGQQVNSPCFGLCNVKLETDGGHTIGIYNYYNYTGPYTLSVQKVSN